MPTIKAVRGTRDLLPPETALWNSVEATARDVFRRYGFGEIRTPVLEATELFARGVGEETDIVSKEMYTWEDRARAASEKAQSLTLRPENTAGVVRAYIEHKLGDTGQLQKLYYMGPQFRRERPQKGRYRQFFQIGAEVIGPASAGSESPLRDAEVLEMLAALLDALGIPRASVENDFRGWKLMVNSVGPATDRPRYVEALRAALEPVKDRMCPDNQRRAETNPLRVLDSKDAEDQEIIDALPKIADYLDDASKAHFAAVLEALDACGVPYTVNPRLVRGLDYYTRTTFEFTVDLGLGTQNALLGGGRYDGLSEMLGGPRAPGIGFAIGEDRLMLTLQALEEARAAAAYESMLIERGRWTEGWRKEYDLERFAFRHHSNTVLHAYIAPLDEHLGAESLRRARLLRKQGLSIEIGVPGAKARRHFEVAEKLGAPTIIFLGSTEVLEGSWSVKALNSKSKLVQNFPSGQFEELVSYLRSLAPEAR